MRVDNTIKQVTEHNIQVNKMTILTMVFFLCCVIMAVLTYIFPYWYVGAICIVFLVITIICAFNIRDTSKTENLRIIQNTSPLPIAQIESGLSPNKNIIGLDGQKAQEDASSAFIYAHDESRAFILKGHSPYIEERLYEFPNIILPYTAYLKDNRDKELSRYAALRPDKVVMGLRSNLSVEELQNDMPVKIQTVSRSAAQITDDSFNKIIINKKRVNNKIIFNGRDLSILPDGRLISFEDSKNANEIDIHTIIISSDGYVMFRKGTSAHPLFPGKMITSASCSLTNNVDMSRPIQESMISDIHKKIMEIYHLPQNAKMSSSFLGFSRILDRGGAPEFYAITRMSLKKSEIVKIHDDETARFSSLTDSLVPSLATTEDAASYLHDAVSKLRQHSQDEISISAAALFFVLQQAMEDEEMFTKIFQRIGIYKRPSNYTGHAVGAADGNMTI